MPEAALMFADITVGAVLLVCGLTTWRLRHPRMVGALLIAAGCCWFAGSVIGLAVFLHRGPLVHLHLSYPTGRLRRPTLVATVGCAYVFAVAEVVVPSPWLTLALAILVALAAIDVYARTSGRARKAGGPALAAALAFSAALALSAANRLLEWDADQAVLLVYDSVICAVALVLSIDLLRGRWTEATIADLISQLGARQDPGGVHGAIQRALGDTSVELGFWAPDQQQYLTEDGSPLLIDRTDGRTLTVVESGGAPLAALLHDPDSLDDELLRDVTAALRLAVSNARMRADARARMTSLAQARRQIVEAADAQRRALADELQVGPERGLVGVAQILQDVGADDLSAQVKLAQEELRLFSQGVRPTALAAGGLGAALPLLVARAPVPVRLTVTDRRLAPTVEAALYFVCAEALTNIAKHADATSAEVHIWVTDEVVQAEVCDDGQGGSDPRGHGLRGLSDRVEALGGDLTVEPGARGGTRLRARLPTGPVR